MQELTELHRGFHTPILPYSKGCFVTLNSPIAEPDCQITQNTLFRFENKLSSVSRSLNKFCYGRRYDRHQAKNHCIAATEIGKHTGRLHAHLLVLFDDQCKRTISAIDTQLRTKICPRLNFAKGHDAIEVSAYDPTKSKELVGYLLKQFGYFLKKYSYQNITLLN